MSENAELFAVRPVTVEGVVPASPDVVFAYVSDTRNDPEWCPNVGEVSQTVGDRVEVGARFEFDQTVEARGRTMDSKVALEVLAVADRTISWKAEDRFQVREISLAVVPHAEGSKVIQRTAAQFKRKPSFTVKALYPVLAKRTFADQFSRLADHFREVEPV